MDRHPAAQDGTISRPTSALLTDLLDAFPDERISVGEILTKLGDRAVGLLLLILALPMCIPNVPGISTIFGVLILAPAAQLILGRDQLWLPKQARAWTVPRTALHGAINGAAPILRRIEHLIRPRWLIFIRPPAEQYLGWQTLAMALVLMLPIPGGNWPPGMTVAATGLALVQRDGRLALISVPMAAISIGIAWLGFRVGMIIVQHTWDVIQRLLF